MNEIKIFDSPEFGSIRTVMIDNEPWFVAVDVCKALDLANTSVSIGRLDDDERSKLNLGRQGETNCVNEYGLYSLVLSSRKKEAHKFKRWVTHEVLPAIRKTGGYHLPQTYAEALRALADKAEEAERLENQTILLIEDNERMKPKEEFFDAVTDSKDAIDMKDTANALHMGIGRNKLFQFLRDQKILTQNNRPYQQYIDCGYFRVIEQKYDKGYGETGVNIKTVVFQRGVDFIRKRLKEHGFGESEGNE